MLVLTALDPLRTFLTSFASHLRKLLYALPPSPPSDAISSLSTFVIDLQLPGQPLGRTILGPKENILSISRDDLSNYIKTNYTADRMVLVGTGGIEHASLVDLAKNHFGSLPTSSSPIKLGESTQKVKPSFVGSEVKVRDDTMPTCNVAIAVEGVSWSSPDYYPMLVMQSVMGNWDRSLGAQSILSSRLSHTSSSPSFLSLLLDTGNKTDLSFLFFFSSLRQQSRQLFHVLLHFLLRHGIVGNLHGLRELPQP